VNVTVAEVLAGAEARAVPLSAECVGYLVLAAADQVSAAPRRLEPNDVLLFEDGGIRVASGRAADGSLAERDLRAVLDALLVRASAPTSGLLRASRRAPGGGVEALVRELETALIPVNRSAAKRSLARLERETVRALQSGRISVPPPAAHGAEPEPTPAPVARASSVAPSAPSVSLPAVVPEIPELSVAPPAATVHERSTVPPPSASVAPRRAELHEPVAALVSTLAPPLEQTELLELPPPATDEVHGETVVLAPVAPKVDNDPQLVETRPEPVVQRASARPPAPLSAPTELVRTEPLTFVRSSTAVGAEPLVKTPPKAIEVVAVAAAPVRPVPAPAALPVVALEPELRPQVTPVLGTRVQSESELPPLVGERVEADGLEFAEDIELELALDDAADLDEADVEPDDGDVDVIEVHFDSNPPPGEPPSAESVAAEASELTEPCPPLEAESLLPPAPVVAEPEASAAALEESIPLAVMLETKLPPVVTQNAAPEALTPPPRIALPQPRPSNVEDLLRRLEQEPLSDAELRSGLRNLAGMEPTPPPPNLTDEN